MFDELENPEKMAPRARARCCILLCTTLFTAGAKFHDYTIVMHELKLPVNGKYYEVR